jgi:hypothetical protein
MIDIIIFIVCVSFFIWLFGMIGLMVWGVRALVRRLAENNDTVTQSKHHKRRGYHGAFNRRHA